MKRLIGLTALGLVTIALVAGCGSSSDNSLTKSEFVAKGNAICKKGNAEIDAAGNKTFSSGQQPTQQQLDDFANNAAIPSVESQIKQLEALDAPSDDQDQVDAILNAARADLKKVKADPTLITDEGNDDPFADANKLANEYGMTECGSSN